MPSGASKAKGHLAAGSIAEKPRDEHTRRGSGFCPMPSTVFPSPPSARSLISMWRQSGERSDTALHRTGPHRPMCLALIRRQTTDALPMVERIGYFLFPWYQPGLVAASCRGACWSCHSQQAAALLRHIIDRSRLRVPIVRLPFDLLLRHRRPYPIYNRRG